VKILRRKREFEKVFRRAEAATGLELVDGLRPLNLALPRDDFSFARARISRQ
jgi:hypothetical protein